MISAISVIKSPVEPELVFLLSGITGDETRMLGHVTRLFAGGFAGALRAVRRRYLMAERTSFGEFVAPRGHCASRVACGHGEPAKGPNR